MPLPFPPNQQQGLPGVAMEPEKPEKPETHCPARATQRVRAMQRAQAMQRARAMRQRLRAAQRKQPVQMLTIERQQQILTMGRLTWRRQAARPLEHFLLQISLSGSSKSFPGVRYFISD